MSISTANPQVATLTRYRFVAVGSETSISGIDANGAVLAYVAGKEQVYINGVLMVRGQDYTATNGTSITALSALAANDVVEILTFSEFVIANAVDQNLVNAKGDLIVATGDNVVTNLAVGTNNFELLADSSQAAGVKWAASPTSTLSTTGDILYASSANTLARLGIGSTGQALVVSGGLPSWGTAGISATNVYIPAGTAGSATAAVTIAANSLVGVAKPSTVSVTNQGTSLDIFPVKITTASSTVSISLPSLWTSRSNGYTSTAGAGQVIFDGTQWVLGNAQGLNYIVTSTDAITWTSRATTQGGNNTQCLIYGSGLTNKYIVGATGSYINTSTDSITWTNRTSNFGSNTIYRLATNGTNMIIAGGQQLNSSTDGVTWTTRIGSFTGSYVQALMYGATPTNKYVAVDFGAYIATSPDGVTWTTRGQLTGSWQPYYGIWDGSKYLIVGQNGRIAASTDGVTWTTRSIGNLEVINHIAYSNNLYIAGFAANSVVFYATSTDSITWTLRNTFRSGETPGTRKVVSSAYGQSKWYMLSDLGGATSTSGTGETTTDYYLTVLNYGSSTGAVTAS